MEDCERVEWSSGDSSVLVFDVSADLLDPICAAS
jgi:hypothetical protein